MSEQGFLCREPPGTLWPERPFTVAYPPIKIIKYQLMADCIFCKIASGETRAKIVYEDQDTLAFMDLNPQAPTHILIIPRRHIPRLSEAGDGDLELLGKLQLTAARVAKQLEVEGGFRLVTNNGRAAGQAVDHLHYHLLGGRKMLWPPG